MIKQDGFTLIEVLIALLIVSIGLGALIVAGSENIRIYQRIEERMMGDWLALDAFNQLNMGLIKIPATQDKYGSSIVLGHRINWKMSRHSLPEGFLHQIEFSYRTNQHTPYFKQLIGYQLNEKN